MYMKLNLILIIFGMNFLGEKYVFTCINIIHNYIGDINNKSNDVYVAQNLKTKTIIYKPISNYFFKLLFTPFVLKWSSNVDVKFFKVILSRSKKYFLVANFI